VTTVCPFRKELRCTDGKRSTGPPNSSAWAGMIGALQAIAIAMIIADPVKSLDTKFLPEFEFDSMEILIEVL
jgi:hypothetical protein